MGEPVTAVSGKKVSLVSQKDGSASCWCQQELPALAGKLKEGSKGEDVTETSSAPQGYGLRTRAQQFQVGYNRAG